MLPDQTQHDYDSGDLFSEEEWVKLIRRANDYQPTSSTAIMSSDLFYVLTM